MPEQKFHTKLQEFQKVIHQKKTEKTAGLPETQEISIWIDTYEDLFSDFDPRPLEKRELSMDFLKEARRRYTEVKGGNKFEIRILVPLALRKSETENIAEKRIREHFRQEIKTLKEEVAKVKGTGLKYIAAGLSLLAFVAGATAYLPDTGWVRIVAVILEPGGWFAAWTGMEKYLEHPRTKKDELEFLDKLTKADVIFTSY